MRTTDSINNTTRERWGDDLQNTTTENMTRIIFHNVNGLPASNTNIKNEQLKKTIDLYHIDILLAAEINVQWNTIPFSHTLRERTKEWWEARYVQTAYNQHEPTADAHLHGGVAIIIRGQITHRVVQSGGDLEGLGWWTWVRLRGKSGQFVRCVTAYRPVLNQHGPLLVYNQQARYFLSQNKNKCPRAQFTTDLLLELEQWIHAGDMIILGIDNNEDIRQSPLTEALRGVGLRDIYLARHGQHSIPTHQRGSRTIDSVFTSPALTPESCGYLAFGEGYPSDHRTLWLDIPTAQLFGGNDPSVTKPAMRKLQCRDPRIVRKFVADYKATIQDLQLPQRIQELTQAIPQYSIDEVTHKWDTIDQQRTLALLTAEQHCRKFKMGQVPWTPALQVTIDRVTYWQIYIRRLSGGKVSSRYLIRLCRAAQVAPLQLNLSQAMHELKAARSAYRSFKTEALQRRNTWLEDLAIAKATTTRGTPTQILAQLRRREAQRRDAKMCRHAISDTRRSLVTMVKIPTADGHSIECNTPQEMEQACLLENRSRFQQAANTPFLTPPLVDLIDYQASNENAIAIRDGQWQWTRGLDNHTLRVIQALQRPTTAATKLIHTTILPTDYTWHWTHAREHTATGRSGLHFGHLMAGAGDEAVAQFEAQMLSLPLTLGLNPQRWCQGLDLAILKKPGQYEVQSLRSLLLLEPDFNYLNKVLGHRLMQNAEQLNLLAPEQYGSRRYRSAAEHAINKCLTFDLSRQMRKPLALCSNDAKSCYDRIVWPVASLALQRVGVPIGPIAMMLKTLKNMRHFIKTIHGVSESYYDGTQSNSFHGVGQGNGAAPAIWAAVSSVLLNILREENYGAKFHAPLNGESLHLAGYAFVDDVDLCQTTTTHASTDQLIQEMQQSLDRWTGTLRVTGGALVPEKSFWVLISYQWHDGKWSYATKDQVTGSLQMQDAQDCRQTIDRIEPNEGRRTLGVRLAADGNYRAERDYLRECSVEWAQRVRQTKLPRHLVWQALITMLWPKLAYPLPATMFTREDCRYIMAPALQAGLAASGLVGTFPRVLTHGTAETLGLEIPHLYDLQGWAHICTAIKHGSDQSSITGRLIRSSIQLQKQEIGLAGPLFDKDYKILGCLTTRSWVKTLWRYLWEHKLRIAETTPSLHLQRDHDQFIMQLSLDLGFRRGELQAINRCRIFLQVITLADIATGSGHMLTAGARQGHYDVELPRSTAWPMQARPGSADWYTWRQLLARITHHHPSYVLPFPLGKWTSSAPPRTWYFSVTTQRLYRQIKPEEWVYHSSTTSRSGRSRGQRFTTQATPTEAADLPPDLQRGLATIYNSAVHFTGSADTQPVTSQPPMLDLKEALTRPTIGTEWVYKTIQITAQTDQLCADLQKNQCVAVSDGSYKDGHGTASWIIASNTGNIYLQGWLHTPGDSSAQCAFRSELAGLYAIMLTMTRMVQYYRIPDVRITIGCDNRSALQRCFHSVPISPSQPHYDLLMAVRYLVDNCDLSVKPVYIPAHQDRHHQHPLDLLATLNIATDAAAKTHLRQPPPPTTTAIWGEPWALWTGSQKFTAIPKAALLKHVRLHPGIQYWAKKYQFADDTVANISWEAMGTAAREVPLSRRIWATKAAAGFLPTGTRMRRYGRWDHQRCPRCGEDEDSHHIWSCPSQPTQQLWTQTLTNLDQWLASNNTEPTLRMGLIAHLQRWQRLDYTMPTTTAALEAQLTIGWENLLHGFITTEWEATQQRYLALLHHSYTGRRWLIQLIKKLWDVSWDFWDQRNDYLHKEDGAKDRELNQAIRDQFAIPFSHLPVRAQRWFQRQELDLLNSPRRVRQAWLRHAALIRQRYQAQGPGLHQQERDSLRRWLTKTTTHQNPTQI